MQTIKPNPKGWQEVDGVWLPPITWAEDEAAEAKRLREMKPEDSYSVLKRARAE
jgi:hypothetical protein